MKKYLALLNILTLVALTGCTPPKQDRTAESKQKIQENEKLPLIEKIVPEKKELPKIEKRVGDKKIRMAKSGGIMGTLASGTVSATVSGRGMGGGSSGYGQIVLRGAVAIAPYENTEQYESSEENSWKSAKSDPLSTFSSDVDTASYSNVRRFITNHQMPPSDAVRIEEMINYFDYNYAEPDNSDPVKVSSELTGCPWMPQRRILKIGIKGKNLDMTKAPASNIVFLLDVSGSMQSYNKLPLLKKSFRLLADNLRKEDIVSIVVYAGAAGIVLDPTPGNEKEKINSAIENLSAGGSTAGAEGIQLAYNLAEKSFIKGGNNRIVLATDGDFNVGISDDNELVKLIENKREKGIFLSILGFGMGNYKDAKMEKLADKGNGNFSYIDNLLEAKKVLVNQMAGTLFTIAKDVKIQVEFNPAAVSGYRLIGYENRMLKKEDFNNDRKDAGEIGAGHTVTALYEIIPANADAPAIVDELKYQKNEPVTELSPNEMATIKIRYKKPDGDQSILIKSVVYSDSYKEFNESSGDTRFAISVAVAGMLFKNSKEIGKLSWKFVIDSAKSAKGKDNSGYRAEFINLVEKSELISTVK